MDPTDADGRTVILRDSRDAQGSRWLGARLSAGRLLIDGQDLGPGVEAVFDAREYEWTWTVEPADLPAALVALGGEPGTDPLAVVEAWARTHRGEDPGGHLRARGVPVELWTRIGD